jgi:UrcA family protein
MKTTFVKGHVLSGLAAVAVALSANLACAGPRDDGPRTLVVRYLDLDLSQPRDARRLYGRIKSAARAVCENAPYRDMAGLDLYEKCVAHAVTAAVKTVNAAQLSQVSAGDTRLVSRELSANR